VTCCGRSACGAAAAAPAAAPTACSAGPDCVGPITIPRELTLVLHALAAAAAVDDIVPFWICASELARRWSRGRRPICAQVIREPREAVASPATGPVNQAVSFRTALRRAAGAPVGWADVARPVDVTILVSHDGDRLYIERMTSTADGPDPQTWASSFLRLLTALADMPDARVLAHPLAKPAGGRADRAREVVPVMLAGS
jgi:hypothetical protein